MRDRPLSGESTNPCRNASFGRPDQRPSTRLEDRAESTSTTWVWRPRSCMSALVSDVRRGSGGEADPGRAPCGQRCVVGVMACMAGRVRTQTAELNRRSQGSEVQLHPWSAGAAPDEAAKRRSGCQSRCRADGMAAGGKAAIGGRRGAPDIAATRRTPQRAKPGSFTSCRVRRDDSASHAAKRSPPLEASSLYWLRTKACQPSSWASASSACKRWRRAGDIVPGANRPKVDHRLAAGCPSSLSVGSSGSIGWRVGAPSARAFRRPCSNHVQSCTSACSSPI